MTQNQNMSECSVMTEIRKTEQAIGDLYERIHKLEKKLASGKIPTSKENDVRNELKEVRKVLKTTEDNLSQLHRHNMKSFAFVAALCFIIFAIYSLYVLAYNGEF